MTAFASIAELAARLRAREMSCVELTTDTLARIRDSQSTINAFITVDEEGALAQARDADARLAAGNAHALTGIPIGHKDVLMTQGLRTTCASRMLEQFVAPYDAHVVSRLRDAGTVLVGKTNMDEFAMGSSSETSYFGPVRNPWSPECVPGGSSGGSAAAVAAGVVPATTGTDTGGSIRQPAALTGICGLKPTYGLCSRYGLVAFASSLDTPGPFARTAQDCAILLNAMAGHDERDSTSVARPAEDYARFVDANASAKPLDGVRIGIPHEFTSDALEADVVAAVEEALGVLRSLGAITVGITLPRLSYCVPVYYVVAPAEASSNLSRFDGVRYGHRAAGYDDLFEMYCRTRAEGFGAEVKRRILVGTYVLSHGYYDAYYLKAQQVRRLIAEDFTRAFAQCDVIAGPTAPTCAFTIGAKANDPVQMYLNDIFTIAANLTGMPAMSLPCGLSKQGLPIGLQLQAHYFDEARLLNVAHRFQQATDWHQRRPSGYPSRQSSPRSRGEEDSSQ
jgi:aspartyl-tRNA(Asn)/glutamyl-tRNA(Gln) amidotransferase subunit A